MKKRVLATAALALVMGLTCLTGCGQSAASGQSALSKAATPATAASSQSALPADGGVLRLSVNPEIAVTYDAQGLVTAVDARNDDGSKILSDYTAYEGKTTRQVVTELVTAIGQAGYFVEEVEGQARQITIEIEAGSTLPSDVFLDEVVEDVRDCVNGHDWHSPVDLQGETDYGMTDYVDTDYGPNNDGVTDYQDTDYGPNSDGVTDYDDTDYGPNNDGVTDYQDTDYGTGNDGVTDYQDTDYGAPAAPSTPAAPAAPPATLVEHDDHDDDRDDHDGATDYDDHDDDHDHDD